MLERRHRLTSAAGFTAATRRGRRGGSRTLVVHLATAPIDPAPVPSSVLARGLGGGVVDPGARVGFVVSRAVGNAVVRNRVKRRLRHLVRERLDVVPPGAVLVVRALPAAGPATYPALGRDLDHAFSRVGITVAVSVVGTSGARL